MIKTDKGVGVTLIMDHTFGMSYHQTTEILLLRLLCNEHERGILCHLVAEA